MTILGRYIRIIGFVYELVLIFNFCLLFRSVEDNFVNEQGVRPVLDLVETSGLVFEHLWMHVLNGLPVRINYDGNYIHLVSKVLLQI